MTSFLRGIPQILSHSDLTSSVGPTIAPKFTASLEYNMSGAGLSGLARGTYVYDADAQKSVMSTLMSLPQFGPGVVMNQTQLAVGSGKNATIHVVTNGQCMNLTGVYAEAGFSIWSWLAVAKKTGQDVVQGKTCDIWSFTPPPPNEKSSLSACLHGDEPVYFLQATTMIRFANFKRTLDTSKLQLPLACQTVRKPCGSNKIVKETIYVAHPLENYNISGQDVADAKGDAVFLCTDKVMWTIGNYKLLSAFELSVVDSFSQYTNYPPPGNVGFGGDGYHIGRQTPLGVGKHGGQCDEDSDLWKQLGIWYSLPPGGQCVSNDHQLGVNCSWRIERRANTIEMDCLLNRRKLVEKCGKATAPFDDVTEVLLKAIASEDADQGGCPSVKQPLCKQHPACAHLAGDCCPHQDGTMLDCCNTHAFGRASIVV